MRRRQRVRKALIITSLLLFPISMNYLSPYLIVQGAAEGVASGSFVVFGLLFLTSLLFGRLFCGWVCPGAGLQEVWFAAQDRRVHGGDWIKYAIWTPWVLGIGVAAAQAGGLRAIDPLYMTEGGISISEPRGYVIYYGLALLVVVLALAVGKRSFCHHVCWMAPFMVLGRKLGNRIRWPVLGLAADPRACNGCERCTRECPMSLPVHEMAAAGAMERSECILCGSCVDTCRTHAIRYAWLRAPHAAGQRAAS